MATDLSIDDLREALRSGQTVAERAFDILMAISILVNADGTDELAREMVLRALSQREQFGGFSVMLDALARAVGLFPYASPDDLDLRDRIAHEFHRPLNMPDDFVFHREQAEIYQRLLAGESVILSAPTSFGKSRIIDVACSRAVNAGSCPTSHRHVTVARTAKKPHDAGDAGMPVNATEPPPTASNTVAISPGVIATGHSNRCLFPNQCLRHPKSSQSLPWSMRSRPPLPHRRLPSPPTARASAQPKF